MENSNDWDFYKEEEYWYIYWNYWHNAWPFASKEVPVNPWIWDAEYLDWYAKWEDIKKVYATCQ